MKLTQLAAIALLCTLSAARADLTNVIVGATGNDGTGDPLRTAMTKINTNFAFVQGEVAAIPAATAAQIGSSNLVTSAQVGVQIGSSNLVAATVSGITTALGYTPLGTNQTITISGDGTGSGTTTITITVTNGAHLAGVLASAISGAIAQATHATNADLATVAGSAGYITGSQTNLEVGGSALANTNLFQVDAPLLAKAVQVGTNGNVTLKGTNNLGIVGTTLLFKYGNTISIGDGDQQNALNINYIGYLHGENIKLNYGSYLRCNPGYHIGWQDTDLGNTGPDFYFPGGVGAAVYLNTNFTLAGTATISNGIVLATGTATIKWSGVNASNPPTSGSGTAYLFAATNGVTGTVEIYAMDGSGNMTIISPHAQDAPPQMYDDSDEFPKITREINFYTGKVRWIGESRGARLQEMMLKLELNGLAYYQFTTGKTPTQWTNSNSYGFYTNAVAYLDPLTAAQKQLVMVESFADYNTRLGYMLGMSGFLVKTTWSADQARFQADYAAGFTNRLSQWTNAWASYQTNTDTNVVAPVYPVWGPPAVQPVPAWLQKRGVN